MTRKQRAALNRAVQELVDAEVAHSRMMTVVSSMPPERITQLLKARMHYKRLLDKYTDPVVPPTKKD